MPIFKKDHLIEILKEEMSRLANMGFKLTLSFQERVSAQLPKRITMPKVHIPLLIVIPFHVEPFAMQINDIKVPSGKETYTFFNPDLLVDLEIYPQDPYVLCNIEQGYITLGKSPKVATKILHTTNRKPFTVNHGVALLLKDSWRVFQLNMHLSGSRIRDEKNHDQLYVPDFYRYAGNIKMKRDGEDDADPMWGTPSFESIITP